MEIKEEGMKTKTKGIAVMEIPIVLCSMFFWLYLRLPLSKTIVVYG